MAKTDVMQDSSDVAPTTAPAAGMKWVEVNGSDNGIPTKAWAQVPIKVDTELTWGPRDGHRILNKKILRTDGPAKTTGTAIYTYDVRVPGMVYGKFVTCPYGRANVKNIDVSAALKIKGVLSALPIKSTSGAMSECRYEGEPVVAVAAKTMELAEDAVRAVVVEYEKLQHVVTYEDAIKEGAPVVVQGKSQLTTKGNEGQVLDVLKSADAVIEAEYRTPIWHHCCLETHGVVADYRGGDEATIYASTQGTFGIQSDGAKELKLDSSKVLSVVHHMGGGFGSKFGIHISGKWGLRLSKALGVPVKMMLSRREEFLAAGNGEGSVQTFKAGASKDGVLVAMHAKQRSMAGIGGAKLAGQPYQYTVGAVYTEASPCYTNEDSAVPMRAPGHPQACFAMESVVDELSYKIGMDPIEFRKNNLKDDAWHRQLDVGAKAMNWSGAWNKTPGKAADGGVLVRGMGCAVGAWGGGGHAACEVDVKIGQDGSVEVTSGVQDLGTGTRTYTRAIVVEELGLNYEDVLEKIGESKYGNAVASGGSTTTASLAPAVKDAAFNARKAMAEKVAPLLGVKAEEVVFSERKVIGGGKSLTWEQACKALPAAGLSVRGKWQANLASKGAHGASFAEVEIDLETGKIRVTKMCHVQDCGLPLNRLAIESQINGGMIQSMGGALYEGRVVDGDMGIMVNCSSGFLDYKLAGCMEIPELIPIIDDGDTRTGVIGMAEPANIPGVAAIANAVYNACGVRVRDLPITPDKILLGLGAYKQA